MELILNTSQVTQLEITPLTSKYASHFQYYASDVLVARSCPLPHPLPPNYAQDFINQALQGRKNQSRYDFAILQQTAFIGVCSLVNISQKREAEVTYWIARPFWGKGYATKALGDVMFFAEKEIKLKKVYTGVWNKNPASRRVLEKNKFHWVNTLHQTTKYNKKFIRDSIWELEWTPN